MALGDVPPLLHSSGVPRGEGKGLGGAGIHRCGVPVAPAGARLQQAIVHQYYHPVDVDALFGAIPSPKLEHIFYKSKPRYFKRTSSAVWHSPPTVGAKPALGLPCGLKKP